MNKKFKKIHQKYDKQIKDLDKKVGYIGFIVVLGGNACICAVMISISMLAINWIIILIIIGYFLYLLAKFMNKLDSKENQLIEERNKALEQILDSGEVDDYYQNTYSNLKILNSDSGIIAVTYIGKKDRLNYKLMNHNNSYYVKLTLDVEKKIYDFRVDIDGPLESNKEEIINTINKDLKEKLLTKESIHDKYYNKFINKYISHANNILEKKLVFVNEAKKKEIISKINNCINDNFIFCLPEHFMNAFLGDMPCNVGLFYTEGVDDNTLESIASNYSKKTFKNVNNNSLKGLKHEKLFNHFIEFISKQAVEHRKRYIIEEKNRIKQIREQEEKDKKFYERLKRDANYRVTHCWRCGKHISERTNRICPECQGIICSCGTCLCDWPGRYYS